MKLPILSSEKIIKILKKAGFVYAPKRGKGSHIAYCKIDGEKTFLVIVPKRKSIPRGTLLSILKQAGISREEFFNLLKEK